MINTIPGMPPPVANVSIPLDQQLRDRQKAAIAHTVHTLNPNVSYTTSATADSLLLASGRADNIRDHYAALFWSSIAPLNNMAIMEIQQAYNQLARSRFFKHRTKHLAKTTLQRIDRYEKAILGIMQRNLNGDRRQYWLDYSDEHYERMRHDINIFRLAVLQLLTKNDEPDRELKAQLSVSHTLAMYAVGMFDLYFQKVLELYGVDLAERYREERISYIADPWQEVVDSVCLCKFGPVNLNDDPQVKLAFRIIEQKAVSLKSLSDIGETAIALNPNIDDGQRKYSNPLNNSKEAISTTFFKIFKHY